MVEAPISQRMVSIIIVSYNGLHETTAPCLQSIFEQTDYPDFEVIVVDNNSNDGTQEYLKAFAGKEPRLRLIQNKVNRGFAGGNNDAIRVARGNFLVLLNTDTLVSRGWLQGLVRELQADSSIGLVGPVSNSTGNEQTIFTKSVTPDEILEEGRLWSSMSSGDIFPMKRLCFFCAAMRRDVVDNVGLLDESYGLGFYEDDDYCLRVERAGYKIICCEDVFVYHKGSASFGKNTCGTKLLMKNNKKLLEIKFGLRSYKTEHPRDRLIYVVKMYIARNNCLKSVEAINYKIENRLRLLNKLKPHGIIRKIIFYFRLNRLKYEINKYANSI
jgi:GT2 family glycosyltransferase